MAADNFNTNFRFSNLLHYLVFPLLIGLIFFIDDMVFKVSAVILAVVYGGFITVNILNRRNAKKLADFQPPPVVEETPANKQIPEPDAPVDPVARFSEEESAFKVISRNQQRLDGIIDDFNLNRIGGVRTVVRPADLKEKYNEIANEEFPVNIKENEQFLFVLEKILTIIKDSYEAHTAILFLYNRKRQMLSVEKFVSNSKDVYERKFDIENDILSKIVMNGEPELLSEIVATSETDNIIYYKTPQNIRSFVGVPMFHQSILIGILAIDSLMKDKYGIEHIYSLGRYVRLITILLNLFELKYTESVAKRRLHGFVQFIDPTLGYNNETDIINSVQKAVGSFVDYNAFALVYYQPLHQKFTTLRVINNIPTIEYVPEGFEIELSNTLVGKCINAGLPVKISDTSTTEYKRYGKKDPVKYDGSFLAIPLIFNDMTFGVLCFENVKKNLYSNEDVNFLKGASNLIAFSIYYLSTTVKIMSYISIDPSTRLLNKKAFREKAIEDHVRVTDLGIPAAFALIKIDDHQNPTSFFDTNPGAKIVETVAEVLRDELNPFISMGITDENEFGVFLFNTSSSDAQIWADKLRTKIARTPVPLVSKQITTTVSIGLASATRPKIDEVFNNARQALNNAIKSGGNKVRNVN